MGTSSQNVESGQSLGFLVGHVDAGYCGMRWTLTAPRDERFNRGVRALEHRLDRAVRPIGDPSRHASRVGLPLA